MFKLPPLHKQIRVIDVLFALLFFVLIGALLLFVLRKKTVVFVDLIYKTPEYRDSPTPPLFWKVANIKKGDAAYNSLGNQVAVVQDIETTDWGGTRRNVLLVLQVKANYNTKTKVYHLDGTSLNIGDTLKLQLGNTTFEGEVFNVYEKPEDRFEHFTKTSAEVIVKYRELEPWVAESLHGFTIKGTGETPLLKTTNVDIRPAEIAVVTDAGGFVKSYNPISKDVIATFELQDVLCSYGTCYFNRSQFLPLKVGDQFWVNSDIVTVHNGSIMEVKIR
jgi:hypothetical protein